MNCDHNKRIGDNYGVSCQACGEILEGYGYGGWFDLGSKKCIHGAWYPINAIDEECMYCHSVRTREKIIN
jgi:hypothetical protein